MSPGNIVIDKNVEVVNIYIQYEIKETGEINQFNMSITPADNPDKI